MSASPRLPRFARFKALVSRPSILVLWGGGLAALGTLLAVALLAANDFRSTMAANQAHAALLARVLEDQATRTMGALQMALDALSDSPGLRGAPAHPELMEPALTQALPGLSFLRALAVVNTQGVVLASTHSEDVGATVDLKRLGPAVITGRGVMGVLVPGRSLASIRTDRPVPPVPPGVAFIPVLHGFETEAGQPLVLVGLLNPDALSNFQHLTLESDTFGSAITSYSGTVLASSSAVTELAGQSVSNIPIFTRYLPTKEHAVYTGVGIRGDKQMVAFRASSSQPLVVVVEEAYDDMVSRWVYGGRGLLGIGAALVLLVLVLKLAIWRGVRMRESARLAADLAQLRITQSERDLTVLMRSVQELIFRTNASGHITYVNAHWTAFSGQKISAAIGKRLQDMVGVESREDVAALLDKRSEAGVRTCQALVHFDGGRERLFDMAVVPLQSDGRISGFAGSAVDVTDRWVAQQKLQAQIAFQDLLLETNPLPISVTNTQGQLLQVNRAWEEYKGRSRDTVIGRRLPDFLPPDEARVHEASDNQLLRWGGRNFFEAPLLHGDGSRRHTRVIKAAISDEHGQVSGVVSILMDVSEFREAERATREARDAAEETSRAKSEFVANMSHELRTPLQSILGFAELGVLRGRAEPRLAGMFEDIHSAGKRMLALVNDLLEVSKLESTVGTFHLERIDLRSVVRPVLKELDPLLSSAHLQLQLDLSDMPLVAKVDPSRFQQVIRNVLANAIKFSPAGSRIHFSGYVDTSGQVHLVVQDEGPGVPEAELESIFEAFVQSSKTKDGSGGTGLGLAICRKIIEAMGGRIYAQNVLPTGTAFHMVLPARGEMETVTGTLQ